MIVSISGPYYAVFAVFLVFTSGLIGLLRRPGYDRVLDPVAAAGLITLCFICQLIPNLIHATRGERNSKAPIRTFENYSTFGLKISNLLRPVPGHRINRLSSEIALEQIRTPQILNGCGIG